MNYLKAEGGGAIPPLINPYETAKRPNYEYWDFGRQYPRFLDEYENAKSPVPSTIPPLDELLRGGFRAGVHFIGGTTGAGKTAFALYLMSRIASTQKPNSAEHYGVTFISMELSSWEIRARLGSRISYELSFADNALKPYSWGDFEELGMRTQQQIKNGTYEPAYDPISQADLQLQINCPRMRIVDCARGISNHTGEQCGTDMNSLTFILDEVADAGKNGGDIVFIDYLQCIDSGQEVGIDDKQAIKTAVRSLNSLGMKYGVAVVALTAVNRTSGKNMRKGKRGDEPDEDIFRDSSWIEYTGLSAFALISRRDTAPLQLRNASYKEVELFPVKNRRGLKKPIILAYNGEYGAFHGIEFNAKDEPIEAY